VHHSHIDRYAQGDSPVHRLEARAKVVVVLAYTVVLISFGRYEVTALAPMAVFPLSMLWLGGVPTWFALRRVLVLSPFILVLSLSSPFYDRTLHDVALGPWRFQVTGGWLTAADIAAKFALGALALTALMSTTPFARMLEAMRRLGVPRVLLVQLGFLYRYLFVLIDEAMRVRRARDFRGAARASIGRRLAAVGGIIGSLFVRTLDRSERILVAMQARGYTGVWHGMRTMRFAWTDAAFVVVATAYLVLCRALLPAVL